MLKNIKFFFLLLTAVLSIFLLQSFINVKAMQSLIETSGYLAPLLFMLCYLLCSLALFPALFLTIASGVLFGPYLGTFYTLISATFSAVISLLISRFFARSWVEKRAGAITNKIIDGVNKEGWHFVAFVRLVPIFPFGITNYAFGLTRIKIIPYTLTSFFGMFPASFAYSYLGYLGISSTADDANDLVTNLLVTLAIFSCIAALTKILKKNGKKNNS